jgi:hypothetical protein
MTSYSVARAKHATLSGTTVDTVTVTGAHEEIEVLNRSGAADLYVTTDGSVPVAGADNTDIVPVGTSLVLRASAGEGGTVVQILGNGNAYSVVEVSSS